MIPLHHHIRHHATRVVHHIHKHHKKYLLAGGVASVAFFAIKLAFFLGGTFFALSSHDASFAQEIVGSTGDVSTGSTLSGEISTGTILTGDILSGVILTGDVSTSLTGDSSSTGQTVQVLSTTGDQATGEDIEETVILSSDTQSGLQLDTQSPMLTGILFSGLYSSGVFYSGTATGYFSSGAKIFLSFDTSESLSGVRVTLGSGIILTGGLLTGMHYQYQTSGYLSSGTLLYTISFSDIAGNTGFVTGATAFFVDTLSPIVTGLVLTGYYTGLSLQFTTLEPTVWELSGGLHSVTSGWRQKSGTSFITGYSILLPAFSTGLIYDLPMTVKDGVGNTTVFTLVVVVNGSGVIKYSILGTTSVYTLYPVSVASGAVYTTSLTGVSSSTGVSILSLFKSSVIDDFNECKNDIKYISVKMQLKGISFSLQMPQFANSDMKKLVSAFSIYILNRLNSLNKVPQQTEIDDLTRKFNSFLVIMKLVNDDDNACKQTLTTYHMAQFESALKEYGIRL